MPALRGALNVLARFIRDHRQLLQRLVADAMNREPLSLEFARANMPRHIGVIVGLIAAGQRAGILKPVALPQALSFVAGAVGAPILLGSALAESALAPRGVKAAFRSKVLLGSRTAGARRPRAGGALRHPALARSRCLTWRRAGPR